MFLDLGKEPSNTACTRKNGAHWKLARPICGSPALEVLSPPSAAIPQKACGTGRMPLGAINDMRKEYV